MPWESSWRRETTRSRPRYGNKSCSYLPSNVSDSYHIHLIRIRIQHFGLNSDPDLILIKDFDDQKLEKKITAEKKLNFFFIKTTIYLSLGLHKVLPSYLQPSKENIQRFKTLNVLIFYYFWGVSFFCPPVLRREYPALKNIVTF